MALFSSEQRGIAYVQDALRVKRFCGKKPSEKELKYHLSFCGYSLIIKAIFLSIKTKIRVTLQLNFEIRAH